LLKEGAGQICTGAGQKSQGLAKYAQGLAKNAQGQAKNAQWPDLSIYKLWVPVLCHNFEFFFFTGPVHSAEHLALDRCGYFCI